MRYARIDKENKIIELIHKKDVPEGVRIHPNGKPALREVIKVVPSHDPETEKIDSPSLDIYDDRVEEVWNKIDLTSEELNQKIIDDTDQEKVMCEILRCISESKKDLNTEAINYFNALKVKFKL